MADQRRYIILGCGIAGMAAAEAIRERDREAKILMFSREQELCFNRPMLIREFALDGSGAVLFEAQQNWPQQFDVEVRLGTAAESIDTAAKCVHLEDGTDEPYDKLIYALGAEVTIPPIPGADRDSVHVVRTREDMRQIREAMRGAKHAVVIGGGMLGMEDAWGLKEQKLEVAIIEQKQRLAFGQIDQSAGNLMKKRIERMGVPVYLNATVTEIGDGYVTFRQETQPETQENTLEKFEGHPSESCGGFCRSAIMPPDPQLVTIPTDLVILSTGVTPNSALGAKAGLATISSSVAKEKSAGPADAGCGSCCACSETKCGPQWIAVDEHCQTSDPDIYAAGDCAAVNGRNDAIWDEAREMGRVAGANAAAEAIAAAKASAAAGKKQAAESGDLPEVYHPVIAEHVFTGFDTEVFTMADSSGAGTDGVYIRHADVEIFDYQRERYIRASLQDGIIAGILLINASELAPELMEAYHNGGSEEDARQIIQHWKDNHEVDFKPAQPFRRR